MNPLTPPRIQKPSSSNHHKSSVPFTPKTPFGKKLEKLSSSIQSPPQITTSNTNLLTPGPTPRHSSRKKKELGDAISLAPPSQSFGTQRTLFPPTPSTIGSGRSKINYNLISPIRKFETDDENIIPSTMNTKRKLKFDIDLEDDLDDDSTTTGEVNLTPGGQLITDKLAKQWNDEIPIGGFSDDEDEEFITRRKPLSNPFLKKSEGPIIKKNLSPQTEITLINKKGEKIVRKLTKEEQSFKPKNLFDDLIKSKKKVDIYNDHDDI